jgi:protein gp37
MGIETSIPWCDSTLSHDENRFWMSGRETGNQTGRNVFASIRQFERRLEEALTWPNLYRTHRERKPWLDKSRRLVLVDELGDPFAEGLPPNWLAPYLERMSRAPHIWLLLTRESRRMREFFQEHEAPPNFWLGVSVTGPNDVALADELWRIPGVVVPWICAEPLRGPIDISRYAAPECIDNGAFGDEEDEDGTLTHECDLCRDYNGLGWVVAGIPTDHLAGEDELDWILSVRDQCFSAGPEFFLTTLGGPPVSYVVERLLATADSPCRRIPAIFEYVRTVPG